MDDFPFIQFFEVGGCVRDEIMGVKSKDIDYSVVINYTGDDPFGYMVAKLKSLGYDIKVEKPEFLTVRAIFPKGHKYKGGADFVLARKEGDYSDGRRPDAVIPGTLQDDLARRDFTMNAIARASDGTLIDPFGGVADIDRKMIRCVGRAWDRIIREDALRGLRALRFSVTKDFDIDRDIVYVLQSRHFAEALKSVSSERIREEMEKMFNASTINSLMIIQEMGLLGHIFNNQTGIRLMPTMKG